jgi:hypothetical protein
MSGSTGSDIKIPVDVFSCEVERQALCDPATLLKAVESGPSMNVVIAGWASPRVERCPR